MRLADGAVAAVGLEINVNYLAVCVLDLGGRTRHMRRVEAANAASSPGRVLGRIARLGREAIEEVEAEGTRVVGAALAVPGPVNAAAELLTIAPNLGWRQVRCGSELRRRLGRPELAIAVNNEANLAAQAEHWEGAARDVRDFVCVSGAVGVGAGVFVEGRLLRGHHGFAGELGHVTVEPDGALCGCGARGCLETVAGKEALLRAAGIAHDKADSAGALEELLARARRGDERTLAALAGAARALGIALAGVVNLLDPEAVLLGGYLSAFADRLLEPVGAELDARVIGARLRGCELRAAALADRAAVRGAAASILGAVMADPGMAGERGRERLSA